MFGKEVTNTTHHGGLQGTRQGGYNTFPNIKFETSCPFCFKHDDMGNDQFIYTLDYYSYVISADSGDTPIPIVSLYLKHDDEGLEGENKKQGCKRTALKDSTTNKTTQLARHASRMQRNFMI